MLVNKMAKRSKVSPCDHLQRQVCTVSSQRGCPVNDDGTEKGTEGRKEKAKKKQ
jgi:hypothetical protein